ncbi:IS1595 family transposase [Pseudomonas aeruginosa]|nr:IS1595 family transposase [Pseudomonas aeruginosa]
MSVKAGQLQARQTQRAPRRRGGKAAKRGVSSEQVPILVMRNRSGETSDFVLPNTGKAALKAVLPQALADDSVLCSDGSNHLHQAAVELAIEHQAINMSAGERIRGPWHVQNVNAYHSRLKTWLRRFNGISTHYLPNYLGWFRALDRNARLRVDAVSLLALAIGPGPSALNAN